MQIRLLDNEEYEIGSFYANEAELKSIGNAGILQIDDRLFNFHSVKEGCVVFAEARIHVFNNRQVDRMVKDYYFGQESRTLHFTEEA